MSCYISSNDNRFYVGSELSYGQVPAIAGANRIPAVKLGARQRTERSERRDKTGGRTYIGTPAGVRRQTSFELNTYLTGWSNPAQGPAYGSLFEAALGSAVSLFAGGTATLNGANLQFTAAHGLEAGQAITFGGEIRFVTAVIDPETVQTNAPFTIAPSAGSPIGATANYRPGAETPSVSIFDYWSPETAVQRILCGAGVDRMRLSVNGDFHEFEFSGPARDLIDNSSFSEGQGEMTSFPAEPAAADFDYTIVPGHLGQAWLGSTPAQFLTITSAELVLDNNLDTRSREFGSEGPRCLSAGIRSVALEFALLEEDDEATKGLYQAARQRSPISVMFQLGQQAGQLFGVYLKSAIPQPPEFDDRETRLAWRFRDCRAQGTVDDEVYMAFG